MAEWRVKVALADVWSVAYNGSKVENLPRLLNPKHHFFFFGLFGFFHFLRDFS